LERALTLISIVAAVAVVALAISLVYIVLTNKDHESNY